MMIPSLRVRWMTWCQQGVAPRPMLHRWCNATSEVYQNTCDWKTKVDAANADAQFTSTPSSLTPKHKMCERTPISALLVENFGI